MTPTPAPRDERSEYEQWLQDVQWLNSKWEAERNCFADFPAHLAHQAWEHRAALAEAEMAEVREKLDIQMARANSLGRACQDMEAERDELRAELERVKLDARRYEWLSSQSWFSNSIGAYGAIEGDDIDAAIDASRDAEGGGV